MAMTRSTSIATLPRGWRIGRALMRPTRFSDMLPIVGHTDALSRVLGKLVADGLAEKTNLGLYRLTAAGYAWIESAMPLLTWVENHPRNAPARGNDPVTRRVVAP
jgi:DNA-binding HxlR family transcriptional regulator